MSSAVTKAAVSLVKDHSMKATRDQCQSGYFEFTLCLSQVDWRNFDISKIPKSSYYLSRERSMSGHLLCHPNSTSVDTMIHLSLPFLPHSHSRLNLPMERRREGIARNSTEQTTERNKGQQQQLHKKPTSTFGRMNKAPLLS